MRRFRVKELPLEGLRLVERRLISDQRGFLARLFSASELRAAGWIRSIEQINHTHTRQRGAVRGMHFQRSPQREMKLVTCLRGEVWDVALDVRARSGSFLSWHGEKLSAKNNRALLIPEGFAHGFQALTDDVELLYCHSAPYAAESEGGVHPEDPRLRIQWPMRVTSLSERDSSRPYIDDSFMGVGG